MASKQSAREDRPAEGRRRRQDQGRAGRRIGAAPAARARPVLGQPAEPGRHGRRAGPPGLEDVERGVVDTDRGPVADRVYNESSAEALACSCARIAAITPA